jgi:hypothetical protein
MCGFGRSYIALRIILALVIVGMVFCLGVKVGEFKAEIRADFGGWDNMRGNRTMMLHMRNGNGMMQEDRFYMQAPQGGTTQRGMMQQGVPGSQSAPVPPQQ